MQTAVFYKEKRTSASGHHMNVAVACYWPGVPGFHLRDLQLAPMVLLHSALLELA